MRDYRDVLCMGVGWGGVTARAVVLGLSVLVAVGPASRVDCVPAGSIREKEEKSRPMLLPPYDGRSAELHIRRM